MRFTFKGCKIFFVSKGNSAIIFLGIERRMGADKYSGRMLGQTVLNILSNTAKFAYVKIM